VALNFSSDYLLEEKWLMAKTTVAETVANAHIASDVETARDVGS